jgi:hypothetical protein
LFGTENPFVRSELLRGKVRKTPGTGQSLSFGKQEKIGDRRDFGLAQLPEAVKAKLRSRTGNGGNEKGRVKFRMN